MGVIARLEGKNSVLASSNNAPLSAAQSAAREAQIPAQTGRGPRSQVIDGKRVRIGADGQVLQEAKVWINVGAKKGDELITLPFNIALDQMGDLDTSGQNIEAIAKRKARNDLKAKLMQLAGTMKPGERVTLNLSVELYVKADDASISDADNPFIVEMDELLVSEPTNTTTTSE